MTRSLRQTAFYVLEDPRTLGKATLYINRFFMLLTFIMVSLIIMKYDERLKDYYDMFFNIEFVIIMIFLVEYIVRVWCCVDNPNATGTNTQRRIKEMLSFYTMIDLIVLIGFAMSFIVDNEYIYLLRTVRILQILKATRYSVSMNIMFNVFRDTRGSLLISLIAFVSIILIFGAAINFAEGNNWSIWNAIWYTAVTTSTVGYGDLVPSTTAGKMIALCIIAVGIGIGSLITAIIGSGFTAELSKRALEWSNLIDTLSPEDLEIARKQLGVTSCTAKELMTEHIIAQKATNKMDLILDELNNIKIKNEHLEALITKGVT